VIMSQSINNNLGEIEHPAWSQWKVNTTTRNNNTMPTGQLDKMPKKAPPSAGAFQQNIDGAHSDGRDRRSGVTGQGMHTLHEPQDAFGGFPMPVLLGGAALFLYMLMK